ncbi:hypothetical protein MKX01_020052 [Papaver californicum]|nr:hypothetical protein MKX01_020052 [Papaver californicum]
MVMIPENIVQFKSQFIVVTLVLLLIISLIYVSPRILTVLAYFGPLFISTAVFLIVIVFFGHFSGLDHDGSRSGEGLLNYVVGQR